MSLEIPYRSIPDMFLKRVAATPDRDALAHPAPDGSGPVWLKWSEIGRRSKAIAAGLVGLGVDELSMTRVAIPEVKDALRRLTREECSSAVRRAIDRAADAAQSRRILEELLGTRL
jgi:hypothetical protein